MKTIVTTNIRGGCGKTTNVLHLSVAASLAKKHNRVLVVDLDPQAHLSFCLCPTPPEDSTVFVDSFLNGESPKPQKTAYKNLFIIPSRMELTRIQDSGQLNNPQWEEILLKELAKVQDEFDYVFIDTPAAYFKLHVLALRASDAFIISMRPEAFSLIGFSESMYQIENFKKELNIETPVFAGYFLNGVPKAKRLAIERIRDSIKSEYSETGYEIPQSNLFDEARWADKQSIFSLPGAKELQKMYVAAWTTLCKTLG